MTAGGQTPFALLGGADRVHALVERFYAVMSEHEPALAHLHPCTPAGEVAPESRARFAMFLVGWLGGPQDYTEIHGHPRLRMRHARVPVNVVHRDAWLRCMTRAMDDLGVAGEVRAFLDGRFAEVADFMRNVDG